VKWLANHLTQITKKIKRSNRKTHHRTFFSEIACYDGGNIGNTDRFLRPTDKGLSYRFRMRGRYQHGIRQVIHMNEMVQTFSVSQQWK